MRATQLTTCTAVNLPQHESASIKCVRYLLAIMMILTYCYIFVWLYQMNTPTLIVLGKTITIRFIMHCYSAAMLFLTLGCYQICIDLDFIKWQSIIIFKLIFSPSYFQEVESNYMRPIRISLLFGEKICVKPVHASLFIYFTRYYTYHPHQYSNSLMLIIYKTYYFIKHIVLCSVQLMIHLLSILLLLVISILMPILTNICLFHNIFCLTAMMYQLLMLVPLVIYQFVTMQNIVVFYVGILYIIMALLKLKMSTNNYAYNYQKYVWPMARLVPLYIQEVLLFSALATLAFIVPGIHCWCLLSFSMINLVSSHWKEYKSPPSIYPLPSSYSHITHLMNNFVNFPIIIYQLYVLNNPWLYLYGMMCFCIIVITQKYGPFGLKYIDCTVNISFVWEFVLISFIILISYCVNYNDHDMFHGMTVIGLLFYIFGNLPFLKVYCIAKCIEWKRNSVVYNLVINESLELSLSNVINRYYCSIHCLFLHAGKELLDGRNKLNKHERNSIHCVNLQCEFYNATIKKKWKLLSNIYSNRNRIYLFLSIGTCLLPICWCCIAYWLSFGNFYPQNVFIVGLVAMYLILSVICILSIRLRFRTLSIKVLAIIMNLKVLEHDLSSDTDLLTDIINMDKNLAGINLIIEAFPKDIAIIIVQYLL